jgi:hypothetical protein
VEQSRLQAFVEWLLDNLFDMLTILVAGFLVIRYQIRPPAPTDIAEIATWILGVLGLLAVSGLWERNRRLHRIEKLAEEARNLALRYSERRACASDFFLAERRLTANDLSSANTIYFAGKVLARSAREFMYVLGQRLVAGATVRFVILDPECEPVLQPGLWPFSCAHRNQELFQLVSSVSCSSRHSVMRVFQSKSSECRAFCKIGQSPDNKLSSRVSMHQ